MPDRQAMGAMFSVLAPVANGRRRHAAWARPGAVHDRFRERSCPGGFARRWRARLLMDAAQVGSAWAWQAMDGAVTKAPCRRKGTGPTPTDRRKRSVMCSRLTEGRGIPLAVAANGAHRHEMTLVEPAVPAMVIERPLPTEIPQFAEFLDGTAFAAAPSALARHSAPVTGAHRRPALGRQEAEPHASPTTGDAHGRGKNGKKKKASA
ncbi:MAG: hypothetical protein RMJ55_06740 [Roseiflexaceae bacterium]|nr:hypothetical protein [Roseiflexaceae bacterium]